MFLSHQTIEKYIDNGRIIIKPDFDRKNIRPAGIRIHLAKDILIPEPGQVVEITGRNKIRYREVDLNKEEFYLEPNGFVLGATYEAVQTAENILPFLDGRSTVARLGLTTHITASVIDGAFEAPHIVVLEIKNVGNFKIKLGFKDPIAMMIFAELKDRISRKFDSPYRGRQKKVAPPRTFI